MPDILLRNIPDDVADTLSIKAREDGKDRAVWLRERVIALAAAPVVRSRYTFRAYGDNGARATISRKWKDGHVQHGADGCSQEQFTAYQKAAEYAQRNEVGDYEAAYQLLLKHFDEVFTS